MKIIYKHASSINGVDGIGERQQGKAGARYVRAIIDATLLNGCAVYGAVILYGTKVHFLQGQIDRPNVERAWNYALQMCFEWRDVYAPTARLFIRNIDTAKENRRRAA